MPTREDLKMDYNIKDAIESFFQENHGKMLTYPDEWADELEEFLIDRGFDLSCIIQYKNVKGE